MTAAWCYQILVKSYSFGAKIMGNGESITDNLISYAKNGEASQVRDLLHKSNVKNLRKIIDNRDSVRIYSHINHNHSTCCILHITNSIL